MSARHDGIVRELEEVREAGRERVLRPLDRTGGHSSRDGRPLINFSSNDYLNLANDPRVRAGASAAIERYGCGGTASRLMAGQLPIHAELEAGLAELTGHEAALLFPSGFQANLGALTALAGRDDAVISDELNHASIIDAARLSRARILIYRHGDAGHAEECLRAAASARRRVLVSDAVFSMDGDLAPVRELAAAACRHDAFLVVDEAHAIGIFGGGGGLCRAEGVLPDLAIGTLSKALGAGGGFAACSGLLRDLLINRARSFIYSTALAPPCAGGALAALDVLRAEPGLGDELMRRAQILRDALAGILPADAETGPILPILLGENRAALDAADALLGEGFLATAIRPPTVPEGAARLRLSITLAHSPQDLHGVARALRRLLTPA